MEFANHIINTISFDKKSGLLYNPDNDFFIKYAIKNFGEIQDLLKCEEINSFLMSKGFFENKVIQYWRRTHNKLIESKKILSLIIKTTKMYNFRCDYCYEDFACEIITKEKEKALLSFVEKYVDDNDIEYINISWFGGEPLLNMNMINSFMNSLRNKYSATDIQIASSITTNGYLLSNKNIDILLSNNVNLFQITIDGDEKNHNRYRKLKNGGKTFSKIISNLRELSLKENENFNVIVRTNFTSDMLGRMDNYYSDLRDLLNDERFSMLFHTVVDFEDMSHKVSDLDILEEIKRAINFGIRIAPVTEYLKPDANICYARQENRFVVDSNLNVSKCTVCNSSFSVIGKIESDGTFIRNDNFNLWSGARVSDKCLDCSSYNICAGGFCPLYYLRKSDARCMKFHEDYKKEELLKVADLQNAFDVYIHL